MEEDIVSATRDLARNWLEMNTPQKRGVVESMVERITIHKDTVEILIGNLPPLLEIMANRPRSP
jgi:hypothetical protein